MQTRAVDFVGYNVSDLDRSVTFYRDVLNLKPARQGEGWAEFDLSNVTLSIFVPSSDGPQPPYTGGAAVALSVPDVPAAVEELRGKGVKVLMDTSDSSVCDTAIIADPDGNRIFLHRRHDGTAG